MRPVQRLLLLLSLVVPCLALAQEEECGENLSECQDTCLIEYGGSVRLEMKKKYNRCVKRCAKVSRRCTERAVETRASGLDEGALKDVPTSDEVDRDGMPTRTGRGKKAAPVEEEASRPADDDAPPAKQESLRDSELPKSNRTQLKVEDPPPEEKKPEPAPAARTADEPPPTKNEPIELKLSPQKDEEDLRDDRPRDDARAREQKKRDDEEKKRQQERERRRKEDEEDLRNF